MTVAAIGTFSSSRIYFPVMAAIPSRFRLKFEYDSACLAGSGSVHSARFAAITSEAEFEVFDLLAAAALRHFGTPYYSGSTAMAIAKEAMLWSGWLEVRDTGQLLLASARNAGRMAEIASSLGEAVALDLAVTLFDIPLSLWWRIPESGPEGMDFKAPGPNGDIAIEAKGGHGSAVSARKQEILNQKGRQSALEKYGFVLCYQMDGRSALKRKGSYVRVVDPPGDRDAPATPRHVALHTHYKQLAVAIGIDWLGQYLAAALAARERPVPDGHLRELRNAARNMVRAHSPRVRVGKEVYLGRYFDERALAALDRPADVARGPARYFFFGIAASAVANLLSEDPTDLDLLIQRTAGDTYALHEVHDGRYGPIVYTGIRDGILRIDLVSMTQVLDEPLDLPLQR